jgi:ankyrin repeat protein
MKQLLITIAAVVLVGCGPSVPDIDIHDAAYDGNIEAVKQHLAAGTDVDKKGSTLGSTALHQAARKGHKEIAKLLIINDAYVNAKDNYGLTSLHWAARVGCKETAELLIEKGSDFNAKDDYGSTSLHNAAGTGHKEIAELLLANGADVNAKDNKDETPLNMAYISDQTEIADLLSKHGGKTGFQLQSSGN